MRISDWSSDVCSSDLFEQANGCNDVSLSPRIGRGLCGLEDSSVSAGLCRQRVAEHELSIAAKLHSGAEAMAGLPGEIFEIAPEGGGRRAHIIQSGRAYVGTPDTTAQLVCPHYLDKKQT